MKVLVRFSSLALSLLVFASVAAAYDNVTPLDAYTLTTTDPNVYLIDVRTEGEWKFVGHPGKNRLSEGAALEGKVVNVSYQIEKKGNMIINPSFLSDINELFGGNPDVLLIVMCRSGQRSVPASAALEAAGYSVLNLNAGFQGGTDAKGYRTVNGWVNAGLPYSYSGAGYQD